MHKYALLFSTLGMIVAAALPASTRDNDALARAHELQLEYRRGNTAVVQPLAQTLEAATAQSKENAQLWEAMGHAYMSQQGSIFASGLDIPALIATGERAGEAYSRSLALQPNNPRVLASHGMSKILVSRLKGDGAGITAGVDEMNAAVRDAPKSIAVRLTRGFTIIHLPPDMRDTNAVIEDLRFILDNAAGGRPEDVLHVLLGDVHAEMGDLDAARAEYARVYGDSAFAAEQVRQRLADLAKGAVSPASIAQVRAGTGSNCAMCHAPGTDR